ncbi:hypothetical protein B4099_3795 [Heyndrickxia coagulans]|uniref:Uncharacterized protein n=1 Tax=Heyndrickxia coagulans TaxID=1398 RepID=A0A150JUF6_HEYCO|nr:hypothetical protein B4099_3795 [Heyndrickxia coagulans]
MREVSDLVALPKLDIDEKLHPIQKARKKQTERWNSYMTLIQKPPAPLKL